MNYTRSVCLNIFHVIRKITLINSKIEIASFDKNVPKSTDP